jgi:soluble lytic murein transglycosylase
VLALLVAAAFTASDAAPYFADADAHAAEQHFHLQEYQQAAQLFKKYLTKHPKAKDRKPAEFLLALSIGHDGDCKDGASRLDWLYETYPLLRPYEAYQSAKCAYELKDFDKAIERAAKVPDNSPLHMDAMLLAGDALRQLNRYDDAAKLYARYLEKYPSGIRQTEATFKLAEAKERLGEKADELFMKVWVASPLDWGYQAAQHLQDPAKHATPQQLLQRATVLFDNFRNVEAENAFAQLLTLPNLDADTACIAKFNRATSAQRQKHRTLAVPMFEDAITTCAKTTNEDIKAKAVYNLAKCLYNIGEYEKAAKTFLRVETEFPSHSYGDDGRLHATEAWADQNDQDPRIEEALKALPEKHPTGDMRQEALWRLAFRAWRRGAYDETLKYLDESLVKMPQDEVTYGAGGRTLYWKARALDKLGKTDEALDTWEKCARSYPLSYYAMSAMNRMREKDPAREKKLVAALFEAHPKMDWRFPAKPLFKEEGFKRGVELARMGLGEEARREFAAVGIKVVGKAKIEDADKREMLWLTAMLLDRAGVWKQSHWIVRWALDEDWHHDWPKGEYHKKWLLSYPRAWLNVLEPAAKDNDYPVDLLLSVCREESAFDPMDESWANAIGLLQMIVPTAKRFARSGESVTRETLRDPVYNAEVGTRWLDWLWELYGHNPALAVAGHNAGEGAVNKWLKERGTLESDEFMETIPYDETRNYTKRVMSTYFANRWLGAKSASEDPVPVISLTLPTPNPAAANKKLTPPPARKARKKS